MERGSPIARTLGGGVAALSFALIMPWIAPADAQKKIEEFIDQEYGYSFQYPAGWGIRKLPEGEANKDVRVMLQGPGGSSVMVVVEKAGKTTTKEEFESHPERKERVDTMMSQTIEQTYKTVSQNIKATNLRVGERRDLSNEVGIKFYVSTLHQMKAGKPIIVAGIHSFPFAKDYSINFVMTAFLDDTATKEQESLTAVFNSFHLLGEPRIGEGASKPPADGGDKADSR